MGRLSDEQYRELARDRCTGPVDIDFDGEPAVSNGDAAGAYVQCWIWVDDPEYLDEDGMAVDLDEYLDEEENPFAHQSGPNGCEITCAACGWEKVTGKGDDDAQV